mgnify:CR=1 FL=1
MKFKNYIEAQSGIKDSADSPGTLDQVLTSTATGVAWVDPSTISAEAATLVVIECKNTSGATITKGTPVYQTGTVGATDVIEIAPADALISAGSQPAIGLLQTTLNNNGFGKVVITGEFLNFTTDPIDGVTPTTGDKVFLKSGGGLTLTKPTGAENGIQNLGLIGKVSGGNAGSITVSSIMRTNDVPNLPTGKIWVGDGNTIVSDTVFLDEPNGRMGIGTTSPNAKLDVDGAGNFSGGTVVSGIDTSTDVGVAISKGDYLYSNDGNYLRRLIGQQSGGSIDIGQQGTGLISNINFFPGTSGNIDFFGSGSIDMRVASSGNVGIGTTSPDYKLDVAGSSNNADVGIRINNTFDDNNAASEPNAALFLNAASNNGYLRVHGAPANTVAKHQIDLGSSAGGSFLTFSPSGEKMRIANNGNVGIGETAPTSKLEVRSETATHQLVSLNRAASPTAAMYLGNDSGNNAIISSNYSDLIFGRDQSSTLSEWMRIKRDGNVGIGTTSPSEKLDVAGNIKLSGVLYVGSRGIYQAQNTDVDGLELVANASINLYRAAFFDYVIQKQGNVRAGTVFACNDGGSVEYTETSTNDIGDTSDVVLSVDISGTNMRLLADAATSGWSVKSLIRAI